MGTRELFVAKERPYIVHQQVRRVKRSKMSSSVVPSSILDVASTSRPLQLCSVPNVMGKLRDGHWLRHIRHQLDTLCRDHAILRYIC
jgi:hypothetical protein